MRRLMPIAVALELVAHRLPYVFSFEYKEHLHEYH